MADFKHAKLDFEIAYRWCRHLKSYQKNTEYDRLCQYTILSRRYSGGHLRQSSAWLRCFFEKYKKFREEGDIESFTSIIDPEIEIIMHSTGRVIDYDL